MSFTVIIEDEKPAARRLHRMLDKEGLVVTRTLHSVEEALKWFKDNPHPELIFLDIQLSDGLSFEIFDQLDIKSSIIFTTAYDEYALKAFKLNSIDYLMKPIDDEELHAALEKFRRNRPTQPQTINVSQLKNLLLPNQPQYRKRFTIQVGQRLKLINTDEISCFFSQDKTTFLHADTRRSYLIEASLDKLEPELDPAHFFRVNRKFIIHLNDIQEILSYSNNRLEVRLEHFSDQQIIVSRDRVRSFRAWLG